MRRPAVPKMLLAMLLACPVALMAQSQGGPGQVTSRGVRPRTAAPPAAAPVEPEPPPPALLPQAPPPPVSAPAPEPEPEPSVMRPAGVTPLVDPSAVSLSVPEPDRERLLQLARAAWGYFPRNLQQRTGLVNAVDGYVHATMWDVASGVLGIACASRLGLITEAETDRLLERALETLRTLPLYRDELPNREYQTSTGSMTDLDARVSPVGSGWSALDIGRALSALTIVKAWYPHWESAVDAVVARWRFARLLERGELNGPVRAGPDERMRQEGRLGYEQYAAAAFRAWDLPAPAAEDLAQVEHIELEGVSVPYDIRNHAFLTSEPFLLHQLEIGITDPALRMAAAAVLDAQQRRAERQDTLLAVSEDALDREPWFMYSTVFIDRQPWACVDHNARPLRNCETFSAKAAAAWAVLAPGVYADRLLSAVQPLTTPRGIYAGRYADGRENRSLNINTNAVVLEAVVALLSDRRPLATLGPAR